MRQFLKIKYVSFWGLGWLTGGLWVASFFFNQQFNFFQVSLSKACGLTLVLKTNGVKFAQAIINEPEVAYGEYYDQEVGKKNLAEQLAVSPGTLGDVVLPEMLTVYLKEPTLAKWGQLRNKLKNLTMVERVLEEGEFNLTDLFQRQTELARQKKYLIFLSVVNNLVLVILGYHFRKYSYPYLAGILWFGIGFISVSCCLIRFINWIILVPLVSLSLGYLGRKSKDI